MFDLSWGHIVVIAVVALVVIGPKELPTVLRTAGQWMGKVRRMAAEFQGQFQEALREAEMADLKQHFDDIGAAARNIPHFDPIATVRKEIEGAVAEKPGAAVEPAAPVEAAEPRPDAANPPAGPAPDAPPPASPTAGAAGAADAGTAAAGTGAPDPGEARVP